MKAGEAMKFQKQNTVPKSSPLKRLLVVDDELDVLQAISACLRTDGYEVRTAQSAIDGLARIAEIVPDLIISDIRMPGLDGYAFARQLRASSRANLIPIVFLTAKKEPADRVEGFRSGVDVYLTKPCEPDELLAVVANLLRRVERTHTEIAQLVAPGSLIDQAFARSESLTDAEARVASAVARGLTNKQIGAELRISARTVENHISHILAKKGFANRVDIARYAFEQANGDVTKQSLAFSARHRR